MEKIILDWQEYLYTARQTVAEGCVLLKNDKGALPLQKGCRTAIFGRIQQHYYKSGTGSGGMVNVTKVTNLVDGLRESGAVEIDGELEKIYADWEAAHPYNKGLGWGNEPWSQEEMPLTDEIVSAAAARNDSAIVIIGRTAGEDRDNLNAKGAYLLTDAEEDMLDKVCRSFDRVIVLLNVGNIMDMSFVAKYDPAAVMYVWQGGMTGGSGTADILTGAVSPSGKLADTIAADIADYPSHKYFGGEERNFYAEDVYVGYRYFETFAKDKVLYPFGFGLSYTKFDVTVAGYSAGGDRVSIDVTVKNIGGAKGKEVVQVYAECPQGKLGKPLRALVCFDKTAELAPDESQTLRLEFDKAYLASYDDSGATGNKSCYVLESGEYNIYVGTDVRSAAKALSFEVQSDIVTERLTEAAAPVLPFERMKPVCENGVYNVGFEAVPLATEDMDKHRADNIPAEIPFTGDKGIMLADVLRGKNTMSEFIAQLSDDDLACIVRGEGMGSPRVTPGTAAAFGGVCDHLVQLGVPAVCCDDGPSGMRLDSGAKAFSLPNGTLIACTFNLALTEKLFTMTSAEMNVNKVECLLGPGMNIHRHPLNGRNFEYFSEDPYLTGTMAAAQLKGLHKHGVTGTIKHFCGNNQEKRRHFIDTAVSERALREIYLRGFEIAVKQGGADSVMTTYGALNGLWTAGCYDLNTTILRNEWGFDGFVMTDWFASINERNKPADRTNLAAMVRAGNDVYMVVPDSTFNSTGDNLLEALSDGRLARGELQRSAAAICNFVMHSRAMDRLLHTAPAVEVLNRPAEDCDCDVSDLEFMKAGEEFSYSLEGEYSGIGANFLFGFDIAQKGKYEVTLTGSSELGELAQIPCTLFVSGIPTASFVFNGTGGKDVDVVRTSLVLSRFAVFRLNVGQDGVKLKNIRFKLLVTDDKLTPEDRFMV